MVIKDSFPLWGTTAATVTMPFCEQAWDEVKATLVYKNDKNITVIALLCFNELPNRRQPKRLFCSNVSAQMCVRILLSVQRISSCPRTKKKVWRRRMKRIYSK